jgi:hypothetical protein
MRTATATHNEELWERLNQIIKVEEPVAFEHIRRFCPDVHLIELSEALDGMIRAHRVRVMRAWTGTRLTETYSYFIAGEGAENVTITITEVEPCKTCLASTWKQPSLIS